MPIFLGASSRCPPVGTLSGSARCRVVVGEMRAFLVVILPLWEGRWIASCCRGR